VNVQIDPRAEGKAALTFSVNVSGVLLDAIITDPYVWNTDWDENWEARVARTPKGWSAEFKIPFRVLRFDSRIPVQSWGFQAGRYVAHHQEIDLWSYYPRDVANPLSHSGRLDNLVGLKQKGALEFRPFATVEGRRFDPTDQTSASGHSAGASAGLDLKWHVAQDLVLDGAIHPDFGQIEADQVILNLTNYETFFPEKRPLFLEGTEIFAFPLQLLYTRRIGFAPTSPTLGTSESKMLVSVPAPAVIYGAAKLTGRLGSDSTVGALSAVTGRNDVTLQDTSTQTTSRLLVAPLTAYNVLRLRREWGSAGYVGVLGTGSTTFETNGGYPVFADLATGALLQQCPSGVAVTPGSRCFRDSYVGGLDGLWRSPSGDYVLSGAIIESFIRSGAPSIQPDGTSIGPGAHAGGGWARVAKEGGRHLVASAVYTGAGRQLDYNDVGFMLRQNLHELVAAVGYRTLEAGQSTIETTTTLQVTERRSLAWLDLGQVLELSSRVWFRNHWMTFVAADAAPAHFEDREIGNGAALERGGYVGGRFELASDPKRAFTLGLSGQGQIIQHDAHALMTQATLTLSPLSQFTVALIPQVTWSSGEMRYTGTGMPDPIFGKLDALSVGGTLRASYTFTPRLTLQTYAQVFLASGHFTDLKAMPAIPGEKIQLADLAAAPALQTPPVPSPDFEEAALNLNVVFRWEYRLGSTLFFVYSRSQVPSIASFTPPASLQLHALGTRASADVLMLKLSYWWSS
jgi:hypothetical protein